MDLLIVDDELDFLATMSKRLSRRGHRVETAASCGEALEKLAAMPQKPDAVVLDVMLPDRDGLDCLREMKKRWPALTVLMLTGHASLQAGLRGVADGAADYCLKPIELDELLEKIEVARRAR